MKRETIAVGVVLFVCLILMIWIVFFEDDSGTDIQSTDQNNGAGSTELNGGAGPSVSESSIVSGSNAIGGGPELRPGPTILNPSLAADAAVATVTKDEYWLVGYTVDEENQPLSGARIVVHPVSEKIAGHTVEGEDGAVAETETGEKGYYAILLDEPQHYQARSIPPENYLTLVEPFTLTETEKTATVNFVHPPGGLKVKGKVLDKETEQPVEGAEVVLIKQRRNNPPKQQMERAVTDEDGLFTIHRVAAGIFRLEAKADGYVDFRPFRDDGQHSLRNIQVNEITQNKEHIIRMEPAGSAEFHVVDSGQRPVVNTLVQINKDADLLNNAGNCTTNRSGVAVTDKLPNVPLIAVVKHKELGKGYSSVFKPGSKENPAIVKITIAKGASVSGHVTGMDGQPIPEKTIFAEYLSFENWSRPPQESATTDENGEYSIEDLVPGAYRISLSNDSWQLKPLQSHEIELKAGDARTDVNFSLLGRTKELRGKVVSRKNEPLEGIFVHAVVYSKDGGISGSGSAQTDENGEFHVLAALIGNEVQYQLQGGKGYAHTIKRAPMDEDYVIITMKYTGSISGMVLNPEGQPAAGASVCPIRLYSSDDYINTYKTIVTDVDGSFQFDDLDPMDYRICAQAPGYTRKKSEKITLHEEESVESVVIKLETGMEVTGAVVDPAGAPVPSAAVSILSYVPNNSRNSWGTFGSQEFPEAAVTDAEGVFRIDSFPPEGDTLVVRHERFAPIKFAVNPLMLDQQPFTIRMTEGGAIEGKVADWQGAAVSNVFIQVRNYPENLYRYRTQTDGEGEFRFNRLAPASYMVIKEGLIDIISDSEYKTIAVKEGMTARADFGTGAGATVHGTVFERGEPAPGAAVALLSRQVNSNEIGVRMNTQSAANGTYSFQCVPEGEYQIIVLTDSGDKLHSPNTTYMTNGRLHTSNAECCVTIQIISDQPEYLQDLYVASLEVQGTVLDAGSQEPIAGVKIQPRRYHHGNQMGNTRRMTADTDTEGRFTLYPQESGNCILTAIKEGYKTKEFSLSIPSIHPSEVAPAIRADLFLDKDETSLLVRLLYRGEPAAVSWAQFTIRTGDFSQSLFEVPQPEMGLYRVTGMPEGVFDLSVRAYCESKVLNANSPQIVLRQGEATAIDMRLFKTERYVIVLQTPDESNLEGTAAIDLLDMPNEAPRTVILGTRIPNGFWLEIPSEQRHVRLTVPGYQPVEFDPDALADASEIERMITLKLFR